MIWQTIDTFPHSDKDLGFSEAALLCDAKTGQIVVGSSIRYDNWDDDGAQYIFTYSREGLNIRPTHWMPLPDLPKRD